MNRTQFTELTEGESPLLVQNSRTTAGPTTHFAPSGLFLAFVAAVIMLFVSSCQSPLDIAAPDVVLITLDTTRVDRLGSYGCEDGTTPHLDDLARTGIRYSRSWTTSPWTLPSHASLVTGKYSGRHGAHFRSDVGSISFGERVPSAGDLFRAGRLSESETTLAELLAEKGYATAAFVGGPWLAPEFGLLQGYQVQDAEVTSLEGRIASEITRRATSWIEGMPRERPIHLFLNYFDPHAPYAPPLEFLPDLTGLSGRNRALALYDAEIRYMDHEIGKLFEALRASGRFAGALIVVVSDHGELFQEHGLIQHGYWLYEELIRAPMIVRLPGAKRAGEVDDSMVSGVDVLPLIAREVGLSLPPEIDGMAVGERETLVAQYHHNPSIAEVRGRRVDRDLVAVVRWPWKLILSDQGQAELYRLDIDPVEEHALSNGPEEAEMQEMLAVARDAQLWSTKPIFPDAVPRALQDLLESLGYVQ
jgi:arylsulfatase A-like enzyme